VILTAAPQKSQTQFMVKHHYVYHSYEEWGREYIGIRSCDCLPEEDTNYFGSFKDKTFKPTGKTILFVRGTRKEVAEIEIKLHDFFDVAVNPKFANKAKAVSTGFDTTGVPHTEETKKKQSLAKIGEKHPLFGVPRTEEWKKAMSGENNSNYGNTGALSPCSKAVIAIKPDGTQLPFGSGHETARVLGIDQRHLSGRYLKDGHVLTKGPLKGWQFVYVNS
jgi:hypothetical protein